MSIYEFDAEREWALIRRDERLLAKEELRDEVTKEVRDEVTKEFRQETNKITSEFKQKVSAYNKLLIHLLQEQGQEKEEVINTLQTQCALSEKEATEQVNLHWNK